MIRPVLVLAHRWVGLTIAAFLFVSGATGAVISWDHYLDDLLNPHLHQAPASGPALPALELARLVEQRDPSAWATYLPMVAEPGETLEIFVQPRVDPETGRAYALDYNEVFVDPATGAEVGRREWGRAWPVSRETLVSFLYKLHYSLHIPEFWGTPQWGMWLMGGVAVLWTLDSFVGFALTLPSRRRVDPARPAAVQRRLDRGWWARWAPAWKVKAGGSAYRVTFDLHRALSLWTWAVLLVLAFTAFSLNLYREVFFPVMSTVSQVTPTPYDSRPRRDKDHPVLPMVGFPAVVAQATAEAARRGWAAPVGAVSYNPAFGVYSVRFFRPGDDHGAAGVGPAMLFYDGLTGEAAGERLPWVGTAADLFVQAQFPLHSGRILGLPGRVLVSVMGLVVATLSVTGVVIWWRKRAARVAVRRKAARAGAAQPMPAE